jgi:dTDP-4-amino-4,6-dideoxygalactose transaminase
MTQLAVCGGAPAFAESLHVGRPNLGNREALLARINDLLDRRWLSNDGPLVKEFERRVAEQAGVRHCIAVCNATVALGIAIRALAWRGEVIVPSFTFIATAHALQWLGLTPVFADVHPQTFNLDPRSLERRITPRTTGIIGVHLWGRACDVESIEAVAHRRRLKVIYDAAHAFGCSHLGRRVGGAGECEVFSFHATKFINCFEGGALVTNQDALAAKLRLMRNFGFTSYDCVDSPGTNGKMTEVCAAMGLTSLEAMDDIIALNRRNYHCYREGLQGLPGVTLVGYDARERNNYQYIVLQVDAQQAALNRDELIAVLHAENILARKYFWPGCHRMEPYRSGPAKARTRLPQTDRVAASVVVLPTGQSVTPADIAKVCAILRSALAQAQLVRSALRR